MSRVHGSKFRLVYFRIGFRIEFSPIFASLLPSSHAVSGGKGGGIHCRSHARRFTFVEKLLLQLGHTYSQVNNERSLRCTHTHARAQTRIYTQLVSRYRSRMNLL